MCFKVARIIPVEREKRFPHRKGDIFQDPGVKHLRLWATPTHASLLSLRLPRRCMPTVLKANYTSVVKQSVSFVQRSIKEQPFPCVSLGSQRPFRSHTDGKQLQLPWRLLLVAPVTKLVFFYNLLFGRSNGKAKTCSEWPRGICDPGFAL